MNYQTLPTAWCGLAANKGTRVIRFPQPRTALGYGNCGRLMAHNFRVSFSLFV